MEDKAPAQEIEEGIKSTKTVNWDPFGILAKEIYLQIFDKLENPVDKRNFMNAHVKWYDLFESKRTLFLFQEIFKFIVNDERHLGYRLVCSDWDKGVQNCVQLDESLFSLDNDDSTAVPSLRTHYFPGMALSIKKFYWNMNENLEKDMESFSATHPPSKNPFLSRNITLFPKVNFPNEQEQYLALVDSLLGRYGRHIWHCTFYIRTRLVPDSCGQMAKWLSLMPELKTLYVHVCGDSSLPFSNEMEQIRDMEIPQPEMNKLVFLKTAYLPPLIFNKLFGNVKRLEKIQIRFEEGRRHRGSYGMFALKDYAIATARANLKEAFLTLNDGKDFNYLKRAKPFPNIERLVTKFWYYRSSQWPKWGVIWTILENKFPALEHLTLQLPNVKRKDSRRQVIEQSLFQRLNLKKLKSLSVALPNLCSIDFLLECKLLEELKVILVYLTDDGCGFSEDGELREKERIDFNMDFGNMWESNIWNEFPKLRKLEIKVEKFGPPYLGICCLGAGLFLKKYEHENVRFGSYRYEKRGDERKYFESAQQSV